MMRVPGEITGVTVGPFNVEVTPDWAAAYSAAVRWKPRAGEPHPLFSVCYEWPALVALRAKAIPEAIGRKGVHATHDLTIHRLPRPGERLSTTATIARVEARRPGAYVVTRLETVDARGEPVTSTENGTLYRGVAVRGAPAVGAPRPSHDVRREPDGVTRSWEASVTVPGDLALAYSEASRIWNPIHTDRVAAVEAGLPDVILHGTATLALALSTILEHEGEGARRVERIACRFSGMVFMPSTLSVRGSRVGGRCAFNVLTDDGRSAVERGILTLAAERAP